MIVMRIEEYGKPRCPKCEHELIDEGDHYHAIMIGDEVHWELFCSKCGFSDED